MSVVLAATCDLKVYNKGECVFLIWALPGEVVEAWVRKIARCSGQRVDWHWYGGKARVLALGNLDKVYEAIDALKSELEPHARKVCKDAGVDYKKCWMDM